MYAFATVPVHASVVASVSRDFCRRRLVTYHSKTALKATATVAVTDTDKPATWPRDRSLPAAIASMLLERNCITDAHVLYTLTLFLLSFRHIGLAISP